jgi:DNA polymerase I-like protein with 3'-5' exonuclease and polymerase domains
MSSVNIKTCFISRWGNDGYVVEADFSQLEVIGAAYISGDENMYEDILNGVDSHSQSASWLNPYSYEDIREGYLNGDKFFDKMRKNAKGPRFELI